MKANHFKASPSQMIPGFACLCDFADLLVFMYAFHDDEHTGQICSVFAAEWFLISARVRWQRVLSDFMAILAQKSSGLTLNILV